IHCDRDGISALRARQRQCQHTVPVLDTYVLAHSALRESSDDRCCPGYCPWSNQSQGMRMKFFADTAEIAEIRDLAATGLLDGVTTNPTLVHKSGRNFLEVVREIAEL